MERSAEVMVQTFTWLALISNSVMKKDIGDAAYLNLINRKDWPRSNLPDFN